MPHASAFARRIVRPIARVTAFVAMLATVAACGSGDVTNSSMPDIRATPASRAPAGIGTTTGFTFLQPTVRVPSTIDGTFDPLRAVSVTVVCVAATGPVCPTVATFQRGTGVGDIRLDAINQAFTLSWTTPSTLQIGEGRYRIEVWDGATRIGAADARVSITTRDAALAGDGQIAIIRGKPVAIRFRVTTIDNAPPALAGDPAAPAVAAIVLQAAPRTGQNFTTGQPDLPGLPTSVNDAIVHVRTDATIGQVNAALRLTGGTVVGGVPGVPAVVPGILIVRFETTTHAALADRLTLLRAQPGILDARADVKLDVNVVPKVNAGGTPDEAEWEWTTLTLGTNWGLKYMAVPQMWNLNEWASINGTPIEVGVLDAGFFAHDDLAFFDDRSAGVTDTHGTHVAGIIGARFNNGVGIDGINPTARLRVESVTGGIGGLITALPIHISAFQNEYVINVSLGYNWHKFTPFVDAANNVGAQARARADGQSVVFALQAMALLGKELPVIVAAAGNDSRKNGTGEQPAKFNSPLTNAALEFLAAPIIVVESIDEDGKRAASTGVGGHLAAPGVRILSTTNGVLYERISGTSMAAPHIAGLVSFLYGLDPTLPRPTMTSNPMRALLERNSRPVVASPVPSVNAFNAALDIDRVRGNDRFLRVLLDIDDGSGDGNLRLNAFGQVVLSDDLDGNGRLGDGAIDMSDFRRFRDHLLDIEDIEGELGTPLFLNGAPSNSKRDLNRDGVVSADERRFARSDFNGDAKVSPTLTATMSGALDGQQLTDLQVFQSRFDDPNYASAELPALLRSADVTFNLTPCFGRAGVGFVRIVAHPHGSAAITHERLVLRNAQVQVVTVPSSSAGADFDVILLANDGITPIDTRKEFAPADLGQDTFITPPCASVSITPLNSSVVAGGSLQFSATVTGAANTAVMWSATGGSISSSGLFTAGSTLGAFNVTATSSADPLAFASTQISITSAVVVPPSSITGNVVVTGGTTVITQRFRARVTSFPNSEIRWTASSASDGSGFLLAGPTPTQIQSFIAEQPATILDAFTYDSFATLTYLPFARTIGGISFTVRGCLFVNGVQQRNVNGADICLQFVRPA